MSARPVSLDVVYWTAKLPINGFQVQSGWYGLGVMLDSHFKQLVSLILVWAAVSSCAICAHHLIAVLVTVCEIHLCKNDVKLSSINPSIFKLAYRPIMIL